MSRRILLVDDEVNVLQGYQRALRKRFELDVANSGAEALEKIASGGPYAVIVSDMRMPEMNGVELLTAVKQKAPETVRMMLTGNSDQQTAIDAINKGDIFRFLNKPCSKEEFAAALSAGLTLYVPCPVLVHVTACASGWYERDVTLTSSATINTE